MQQYLIICFEVRKPQRLVDTNTTTAAREKFWKPSTCCVFAFASKHFQSRISIRRWWASLCFAAGVLLAVSFKILQWCNWLLLVFQWFLTVWQFYCFTDYKFPCVHVSSVKDWWKNMWKDYKKNYPKARKLFRMLAGVREQEENVPNKTTAKTIIKVCQSEIWVIQTKWRQERF